MNRWDKAAKAYEEKQNEKQKKVPAASGQTPVHGVLVDQDAGTRLLEEFMLTDEAKSAMNLLRVTKRHIIFGEENEGGGRCSVYFIDGNGLQESYEAAGMWMAYADKKDIPAPVIKPITARQAVQEWHRRSNRDPRDIVKWLIREIDTVAAAAERES